MASASESGQMCLQRWQVSMVQVGGSADRGQDSGKELDSDRFEREQRVWICQVTMCGKGESGFGAEQGEHR